MAGLNGGDDGLSLGMAVIVCLGLANELAIFSCDLLFEDSAEGIILPRGDASGVIIDFFNDFALAAKAVIVDFGALVSLGSFNETAGSIIVVEGLNALGIGLRDDFMAFV